MTAGQEGCDADQPRIVRSSEVWSDGMLPGARNTLPDGMSGEVSSVGTRTPRRVKSKFSGESLCASGATWSKVPPCSSKLTMSSVFMWSGEKSSVSTRPLTTGNSCGV